MYSLDMQNPKGHCHPGSVSDLNDHGLPCTEADIIQLAKHTNATISTHAAPNGNHTLLSKYTVNSKNTVILITGGDHRPYCLDSNNYPGGYLLPGNTMHLWTAHNINVILIIPPYIMDWSWQVRMKNRNKVFKDSNKMIRFKKNKNIPPHVGVFNSLLMFEEDIDSILCSIPKEQKVWLAGHCSSADFLARYADMETLKKSHGLIMWNPTWIGWQHTEQKEKYFQTQPSCHLLVVQHKQDPAISTSEERARHIVDHYYFNKKLKILDGGINHGLPCFSLGYHGFKDIEDQLVKVTAEFINNSSN
jgi:hypothetical protein